MRTPTLPVDGRSADPLVTAIERVARDLERVTIVLGLVVGLNLAAIFVLLEHAY